MTISLIKYTTSDAPFSGSVNLSSCMGGENVVGKANTTIAMSAKLPIKNVQRFEGMCRDIAEANGEPLFLFFMNTKEPR